MNVIEAVQKEIDARGYKDVKITRQTDGNKAGIGLASTEKRIAFAIPKLNPGETPDDRSEESVKLLVYLLFEAWEPRET
jgi:hypothetical protein